MRRFLIALQFLTILPVPSPVKYEADDLGRATAWFPLAGLTIGVLLLIADMVFAMIFPRQLGDALLIALLAIITGALHLDGLADVFDGLAARGGKERFLTVMKDSRVGAVGVTGLVIVLMLKYLALLAVPVFTKKAALLLFPLLGRFTQLVIMHKAEAMQSDGLAASFLGNIDAKGVYIAAVCVVPLVWLFGSFAGISALCLTTCWGIASRIYFTRRLGGINGDIIGFGTEIAELLALLGIIATTTLLVRFL